MNPNPANRPPTPRRIPSRMLPRKTLQARTAVSDEDFDNGESESEPNMKLSHAFVIVLLLHVLAVGGVFFFNSLKDKKPGTVTKTAQPGVATPAVSEPPAAPVARPVVANAVVPKPTVAGLTHVVVSGETLTRIAAQYKSSVEAIEKANDLASAATIRVGQTLQIPSASKASVAPREVAAKPPTPAVASVATPTKPVEAKPAPVVAKPVTPPTVAVPVAAESKSYTIVKGDNPYAIAKKLKVSYNDLMKANKITDPTKLQIGQKLIIP